MEGSDLNLTSLLGVGQDTTKEDLFDDHRTSTNSVEQTKQRIEEVQNLRRDIDHLRTSISDRYAENIGDNCTTQ